MPGFPVATSGWRRSRSWPRCQSPPQQGCSGYGSWFLLQLVLTAEDHTAGVPEGRCRSENVEAVGLITKEPLHKSPPLTRRFAPPSPRGDTHSLKSATVNGGGLPRQRQYEGSPET